jgi:citrate synthase
MTLRRLLRAALVLCADHELNVSAFAARVVASTGAHLHATVCAGLSALSGPRHGGATARAYALIAEARDSGKPADHVQPLESRRRPARLRPRAVSGWRPAREHAAGDAAHPSRPHCGNARHRPGHRRRRCGRSGQRPNIDFLLAAICHVYGLPATPALVLFASGRLTGWLAHALEQQALGN